MACEPSGQEAPNFDCRTLLQALSLRAPELKTAVENGVLHLRVSSTPPPSLPQALVKAGITRLILVAVDGQTWPAAPVSPFRWQGIDGTQIETWLSPAGTECCPSETNPADTDMPLWLGELPALRKQPLTCPAIEISANHQRLLIARNNALFLNCVKPSGLTVGPAEINASSLEDSNNLIASAVAEIASIIDTRGLKRPILVVSNLSHFANEAVSIPLRPEEIPVTAIGPEGDAQQVQIVESGDIRKAVFIPKNVPLHGYAIWDLGATLIPAESEDEVSASRTHLENSAFRIEFDSTSGLILRIFDKDSERELLNETFVVHRNGKRELKPQECANALYSSTIPGLAVTELASVELLETGPVRGAIRFSRRLHDGVTIVRQTVRLISGSTRIDFETEIEHEGIEQTITLDFPVAINSTRACCETPFGYVERQAYYNTSAERDRYETGASRWIDVSEGDYGIALLTDVACAMEAQSGRISVSYPCGGAESTCSRISSFTCSLLPHGGDIREGEVIENSAALVNPLVCTAITGNRQGKLPLERSFFEVDNAFVFIDALYALPEENSIVARLVEGYNTRGEVLLTTTLPARKAFLCDLLDEVVVEVPIESGEVVLPIQPFEINAIKFSF